MLETLFGSVLTSGITAASFTVCLIAALALGALVAAVYMYKNTCTQSMAVTLALLPAMVQIIILLVNGNLGAGVAVSGAFGLVRFRSAPGSARDITCIFLAMTLGLATGMGYIGIAVMTGVVMCLLLLVYAAMSFGRRPEEEKELKITIPENLDYTGLFDDLESITAVNNGVRDFKGTVLFASHDHEFVQTIATRIIEIREKGVLDKECTYDEFLDFRETYKG